MSAAYQVQIGSTADTSGVDKMKGSILSLDNEVKKKFSASGIGKSIMEGLGIGGGLAIATTLTEALVKPIKEAAEWAEKLADQSDRNLAIFQQIMAARRKGNAEMEISYLKGEEDKKRRDYEAAQAKASKRVVVNEGMDQFGEQKFSTTYEQTGEEKVAAKKAEGDWMLAAEALRQYQAELAKTKASESEALALKTTGPSSKTDTYTIDPASEAAVKAFNDELRAQAQTFREGADPAIKYNEQLRDIELLETAGAMSAADAAKAKAKLNAEFNQSTSKAIDASNDSLREFDIILGKIENNPALTDQEKRKQRAKVLASENVEIAQQIKLIERYAELNPNVDPAAVKGQIRSLNEKSTANELEAGFSPASKFQNTSKGVADLSDPSKHYQGMGQGIQGGAMEFVTELGTTSDQTAGIIRSGLGTAVSEVSAGLNKWDFSAKGFFKGIAGMGVRVFQMMKEQIIQMGVNWAMTQVLIKTGLVSTHALGETLKASSTASTMSQEAAKTPVLATNAGLASVSSFGVAAILGIALLIAGIAALAFEKGGVIPGGEQLIRVNENGTESVLNAGATGYLGAGFVAAANRGEWSAAAAFLAPDVVNTMTQPRFAPDLRGGGGVEGGGMGSFNERRDVNISVISPDMPAAIRDFIYSPEGERYMLDLHRKTVRRLS